MEKIQAPQEGKQIQSEKRSRKKLLVAAREMGFEADLLKVFARFDDFLKGTKDPEQIKAIQILGISEIDRLFNIYNVANYRSPKNGLEEHLVINNQIITNPSDKIVEEAVSSDNIINKTKG